MALGIPDLGFDITELWIRIWGSGFRIWTSVSWISDLRFMMCDLWFRIWDTFVELTLPNNFVFIFCNKYLVFSKGSFTLNLPRASLNKYIQRSFKNYVIPLIIFLKKSRNNIMFVNLSLFLYNIHAFQLNFIYLVFSCGLAQYSRIFLF